jgi:hypothetical protein
MSFIAFCPTLHLPFNAYALAQRNLHHFRSVSNDMYPEYIKLAFITQLKNRVFNPQADKNCHPFSLLSFLFKFFERAATLQLVKYLESNSLHL